MRTPVTLKIKFKSSNLDQFIERYSVDVSRGGIFIRTKEPLAVGTQLKFEFQLQDASSLISGEGTVVWIREHDPARSGVAPGMGVRFDKLAATSQQVLDRILNEKGKRGEAQMESRFDAGVRASASASGNISTQAGAQPHHKPNAHNDFGGGDSKSHTPLPAPAPGLDSGADEFGEESTRVMQDAVVQALADRTRGDTHGGFGDAEPTKRATVEQLNQALAKAEAQKAAEAKKPELKSEVKVEVAATNGEAAHPAEAPKPEPSKPVEVKPAEEPEPKMTDVVPPRMTDSVPEAPAVAASVPEMPPPAARPKPQKSSALPMMVFLALGIIGVGGYVVYRNSEEPPKPVSGPPSPAVRNRLQKAALATADNPSKPPEEATKPTETPTEATKPAEKPALVATKPAEKPTEATKPVEAVKMKGLTVPVSSDPPGGIVSINGKQVDAVTPTELSGLEAGKSYDVRVTMKGFHEWKTTLKPKAGDKVAMKLVANEKLVEVSSTPQGADVMLDGKRVGKTPFTIHKLDLTKPHELSLKRAGFVEQKRNITAEESFESKGDKDVLAVAMTLEAEPKAPAQKGTIAKKGTGRKSSEKPSEAVAEKPTEKPAETAEKPTEKPAESAEKPAVEKPAEKPAVEKPAEKPAEKPVAEKPAEKPAAKPAADKPAAKPAADKPAEKPAADKPADKDKNLKTPSWMQDSNDKPAQ